jgi:flagellin-specific chaperone FliS
MIQPKDQAIDIRNRVVESAHRLGVQMNEQELERWMKSITEAADGNDIVVDKDTGVFGHKVSMLDFDPHQLARFRAIGKIVEFEDIPGVVETALALSGSAAQSKIQTYPGDCDYFERVNIIAPTRTEACEILAKLIHDKSLNSLSGSNYQLLEVKFGSYSQEVIRDAKTMRTGSPISWLPHDIIANQIEAIDPKGNPVVITWESVAQDPGWCKLDWVIADTARGQLSNASNILDVTWEAPDGVITPLDGYLDGYFQEIYLDAESAPIFAKLVKQFSTDAMDVYVARLEGEVKKCVQGDNINYGKAAKRLYNIFRLNGRYEEAAFMRELFDEPAALLYQVHALMRTVQEATDKSTVFDIDSILNQTDDLIFSVIKVLEGEEEVEIVRHLLRLYRILCRQEEGNLLRDEVDLAQAEVMKIVNNFFYEKMTAVPTIKTYIEGFQV